MNRIMGSLFHWMERFDEEIDIKCHRHPLFDSAGNAGGQIGWIMEVGACQIVESWIPVSLYRVLVSTET